MDATNGETRERGKKDRKNVAKFAFEAREGCRRKGRVAADAVAESRPIKMQRRKKETRGGRGKGAFLCAKFICVRVCAREGEKKGLFSKS